MAKKIKQRSRASVCIISLIITLIITAVLYYFLLPPLNIHSAIFWTWIIGFMILFLVIDMVVTSFSLYETRGGTTFDSFSKMFEKGKFIVEQFVLYAVKAVLLVVIVGGIAGGSIFRAKTYAGVIEVQEADFATDMPETNEITNIALMDTESAEIIGNRALGNLSEVVSQYEIAVEYTQINYNDLPKKVANLEYNGFFKWFNNKKSGIPGYVMVDPLKNSAKYVELDTSLKYVESGCFGDDLDRKLRFSYPTKIFGTPFFEIDEEGNPYYIVSCYTAKAGLFGAKDVNEVVIFNPCDGSSELYELADVPTWVDIVFDGDLACEKYNWKGIYENGFFNSVIGQKGCKQTTDDFGYVMLDDDVWYYTGVTSVLADESNIGFILTNARTGEYKYYPVVGAEEHSAMAAAEGEVQEKGYVASFPSLVNISGQASYIMVLKDDGGLVKRYALVNVENYGYVGVGETQAEAIADYKRILIRNGIIPADTEIIEPEEPSEDELKEVIRVEEIRLITISGNTYAYITGSNGDLYKVSVADNEEILFVKTEDTIDVSYKATDIEGIYEISGFSIKDIAGNQDADKTDDADLADKSADKEQRNE